MESTPQAHKLSDSRHTLSLLDATAIIIGIIIGPGIFETGPLVARHFTDLPQLIMIWLAGGLLSLTGVLCYAELASRYPDNGGEFVWLRAAYGNTVANLFLWAEISIIRPGAVAAMAFPAATYLSSCIPGLPKSQVVVAILIVLAISAINILGLHASKVIQNILSAVKILALVLIIVTGFAISASPSPTLVSPPDVNAHDYGLALILVLFTFGGWNEIANVTADMRGGASALYKASLLSLSLITTIYILINVAYVNLLGFSVFSASNIPVVSGLELLVPTWGVRLVALLIAIACAGAIQGMVFTGARLYDRSLSTFLGLKRTPSENLTIPYGLQAILSVVIILVAGTFADAVIYTTTVVWICFLLRGLCVPILRAKNGPPAQLAIPLYPIPLILFCLSSAYLVWSAYRYSPVGSLISGVVVMFGIIIGRVSSLWIRGR